MMPKEGFTLTELLVASAIIALLAALLFPTFGAAQAKAQRTVCRNNLGQISLDEFMYAGDSQDSAPKTAWTSNSPSKYLDGATAFKRVLETQNVSNLFSCPADTFYFAFGTNAGGGFRAESLHAQLYSDYSSYGFNGGERTLFGTNTFGIAGRKLSSIRNPGKTVLIAELSAYYPWSWHYPAAKAPLFNDAKNIMSFVDGHVSDINIYWNTNTPSGFALEYDPPDGYNHKWSGD